MNHTQLIQSMAESILAKVQQAINGAEFDRTYTAVVTGKAGIGKYNVLFRGQEHPAKSSATLSNGDTVMVCSPCGNDADLFIVCKI